MNEERKQHLTFHFEAPRGAQLEGKIESAFLRFFLEKAAQPSDEYSLCPRCREAEGIADLGNGLKNAYHDTETGFKIWWSRSYPPLGPWLRSRGMKQTVNLNWAGIPSGMLRYEVRENNGSWEATFYALSVGLTIGIYDTWEQAQDACQEHRDMMLDSATGRSHRVRPMDHREDALSYTADPRRPKVDLVE